MKFQYKNKGYLYMHGGDPLPESSLSNISEDHIEFKTSSNWKANADGSVTCAPKDMGGCSDCVLELKRILPCGWISNLGERASNLLIDRTQVSTLNKNYVEIRKDALLKAASREDSDDNYLYCPVSSSTLKREDFLLFQRHWVNGEPIIVQDVLKQATGLSWEPMVMWRALSENTDSEADSKNLVVKAIDCLAGCEV